jgi:hypothetical protein
LSAKSTEAGEWMSSAETTSTSGGTSSAGVEASGAKLVKLLALLGVGKNLVGGLDIGELVLGLGVLIRIGMVLFR